MIKRWLIFIALVFFITPAWALERFEIVTTQQLEAMLQDRAVGKTDFVLVNSLDEMIFRNSSIPGSINVPWNKTDENLSLLGENKNRLLVFY